MHVLVPNKDIEIVNASYCINHFNMFETNLTIYIALTKLFAKITQIMLTSQQNWQLEGGGMGAEFVTLVDGWLVCCKRVVA